MSNIQNSSVAVAADVRDPKYIEDPPQRAVTRSARRDIGVVMDIMIHDLDVVLSLASRKSSTFRR